MADKTRYSANLVSDTNLYVDAENDRVGIGTTIPTSKLTVNGDAYFTGTVTATSFSGTSSNASYADTAGIATALQNSRTFEITGDILASPISFNGTGNVSLAATIQPNSVALGSDTTGDYVQSISGTANQITVTGGSGEGSAPVISIPSNPTLSGNVTIGNDLQVNNNLNVSGNITIGGTSAYIVANDFRVKDADIVVGYTTDSNGNDASNDTTANHGGIAVASTEGSPLVQLYNVAIGETNPATYKKIMWFKSGAFTGLNTDAWLINYGVGIGSTQFPSGTRLAVGSVQITQDDLAVVRSINASGISTFTNGPILIGSGTSTGTASQRLQVTGGAYISGNVGVGITNPKTPLEVSGEILSKRVNTTQEGGQINFARASDDTTAFGIDVYNDVGFLVDTTPRLRFIDVSASAERMTLDGYGNLLINKYPATGTASQPLQVTGGAYFSGNVGIGTTNPTQPLYILSSSGKGTFENTSNGYSVTVDPTSAGPRIYMGSFGSSSFMEIAAYGGINNFDSKFRDLKLFTSSSPAAFIIKNATGNVGIGTTNPTQSLDVNGTARIRSGLYDGNNNVGTAGSVLSSTGTKTEWISPPSVSMLFGYGDSIKRANNTYFNFGGLANATESNVSIAMPTAGTMSNFYIKLSANASATAGVGYTFTVRKNSAATSLVVSILGASNSGSDLVDTVSFQAGDLFTIEADPTVTQPTDNLDVIWTAKFVSG